MHYVANFYRQSNYVKWKLYTKIVLFYYVHLLQLLQEFVQQEVWNIDNKQRFPPKAGDVEVE